jgi:rhamnogalacturonyl hydrolase YesR
MVESLGLLCGLWCGVSGDLSSRDCAATDLVRSTAAPIKFSARSELDTAAARLRPALFRPVDGTAIPRTLAKDGKPVGTGSREWTSGFYPGLLWLMYEYSRDAQFERAARQWSALLEQEKKNTSTHDVGFIIDTSFGNGYRLTGDEHYRAVVIDAARSLTTRFNAKVGAIRSWDFGPWKYPVIIDNMINLELLFVATRLTGDPRYRDIAVAHANTTLREHFRHDGSSYHVVDFDPLTGAVRSKGTLQGASDDSTWARGQAWAVYGFTVAYRETRDPKYLRQAETSAAFILDHLPPDFVPYWDYSVSSKARTPRDASAAAIAAAALYELAEFTATRGSRYRLAADRMLVSLSSTYRAIAAGHSCLLLHSTGSFPQKTEIDVPLIYADYYYVQALLRRLRAGAQASSR